jgi:ABC-type lipoprotein release transport system permease subunit
LWSGLLGCWQVLVGAFAFLRLLSGLLFGVATSDPVTFVAAPLILGTTTLVASWLPARRASRIDPVVALRAE